jgi:hypothetical protein
MAQLMWRHRQPLCGMCNQLSGLKREWFANSVTILQISLLCNHSNLHTCTKVPVLIAKEKKREKEQKDFCYEPYLF